MKEAFDTDDHMKVALIILDKGELEVSGVRVAASFDTFDRLFVKSGTLPFPTFRMHNALNLCDAEKERALMFDSLFRDIATIIADKCLNPESRRPYTVTIIEKALR